MSGEPCDGCGFPYPHQLRDHLVFLHNTLDMERANLRGRAASIEDLSRQLAAERKKVRKLEEFLLRSETDPWADWCEEFERWKARRALSEAKP